jgi:antitoxin HigA-1
MAEYMTRRPVKRAPTRPGELMREILAEHLRLSVSEAARRMKISRQSLHAALDGRGAVTAEMALRFARLTGSAPELLVRMQAAHDLWRARRTLAPTLRLIERAA